MASTLRSTTSGFPARVLTRWLLIVWLLTLTGCPPPGSGIGSKEEEDTSSQDTQETAPRVVVRRNRPRRRPPKRLQSYPGRRGNEETPDERIGQLPKVDWAAGAPGGGDFGGMPGPTRPGLSSKEALERLWRDVADAAELGPTEICWLIDVSPSARQWHAELVSAIAGNYRELPSKQPAIAKNLTTRLGTFADTHQWLTPTPLADETEVAKKFEELPKRNSAVENVFAAVAASLKPLRQARLKERKEVLLVILTDEAGNDGETLLTVLPDLKKYGIPVTVLGVPAPFGRRTLVGQKLEGGKAKVPTPTQKAVIVHGPETQAPERLHLMFTDSDTAFDQIDSGFGPYALEQLCFETGGRFWGMDVPSGGGEGSTPTWPGYSVLRFDPSVMKKYRPKLQSREEYEAFVQAHRCCQVLVEAARIPTIPVLSHPQLVFAKDDPPKLKNTVDAAQQAAAKVELEIHRAYDLLKQGLADRKKLTDRRWCASYDLAMGRIAAAKARVDGYNAMLAALKRGIPEKNPDATSWVLAPAETTELTSSRRSLIKQAREHLERVVREHPGTPWEFLAKEELKTPLGWKWTEQ